MNVLINAISITEGGGFVVLTHLLKSMKTVDPKIVWHVVASSDILACLPKDDNIVSLDYTWAKKSPIHLLFWYEIVLPKVIRDIRADILFSQTNFLPKRKISCPSLLLVQHAGYFSKKFTELYFKCFKKKFSSFLWKQRIKWVYRSIKQASIVTVQTNDLAKKICELVKVPKEKLIVIPHGPGLAEVSIQKPKQFPENIVWRIGFISKFNVQKGFDTAIKAIGLLRKSKFNIKLILTLDKNSPENIPIFDQIKLFGIEDSVENHGNVTDFDQIRRLYESLHLFIFPSFCESFGFTMVEAMTFGLPLVIADTASNREVAGNAGEIFTQENEIELANKIQQFLTNKELYEFSSQKSIERSKDFSWFKTAQDVLNVMYSLKGDK